MRRKLLVADNNPTIQRVIELAFAGESVDVVPVSDGDEAVARIPVERPDIVVADVGLPKRTGYDLAAFINSQPALAHIPVLLLAGAFDAVDDDRVREVGCDGVLVKPFDPQLLVSRFHELLDETVAPQRPSVSPSGAADDYFERLDAAFAQLSQRRASVGPAQYPTALPAAIDVPPVRQDPVMGIPPPPIEPPESPSTLTPDASTVQELAPTAVSQPTTDEMVQEVTQRVLQRLSGDVITEIVTRVVSEVLERLIKDEVERNQLS